MKRIYLAPIQGVTTEIYRKVYHELFPGVDVYFSPFLKVKLNQNLKKQKNLFTEFNPAIPLVPQILSNLSEEFLWLDHYLYDLGYPEFNWNLGCPVSMVTQKKRGAGLLPYAEKIQAILETILPQLRCRLSIKVRLGLNRPEELLTLLPVLNQFPISELIIHPRLGRQLYAGQVDLQAFAECLRVSRHPVVYNGDIFNAGTLSTLQQQFPQIQHWMLGRGILVNPFLPAQVKGLPEPAGGKLESIRRFQAAYADQYREILSGPTHILDKLKGFWYYLHRLFEAGEPFFNHIKKMDRYEDFQAAVERFLAEAPVLREHVQLRSEDFK